MARQPFLPSNKGAPYDIGYNATRDNPELAKLIGECVTLWSNVELHLALTMGSMLGVENPASVAVFGSIRNHRSQRDALRAAAKHSLSPKLQTIFDAILAVHKRLDGQRNDVVHGIWGRFLNGPTEKAIWISSQDYANDLIVAYHKDISKVRDYDAITPLLERCWVWPLTDLTALNDEIREFSLVVMYFHVHLRYRDIPVSADAALRLLETSPLLQIVETK